MKLNRLLTMSDAPPLHILLVSSNPELVDWFREDVVGTREDADGFAFSMSGEDVRVTFLSTPLEDAGRIPASVDLLLGLIRFVDVISLTEMSGILKSLPSDWNLPTGVMVYRKENESDFKMSCPYCGQKIWVRDADVDKRGRCPNCKKGFTLPAQDDHVATALGLRESVAVRRVERGNPASISAPLRALLRAREGNNRLRDASESGILRESHATMNVDVEPSHPSP